jgi:serine/threonine protein kinase
MPFYSSIIPATELVGNYSLDNIIGVMAQAAEGLDALHKVNVFHRDIKPDNILITEEGRGESRGLVARIADLGLAKQQEMFDEEGTLTGVIVGTPNYMPPEQFIDSRLLTAAADIYSLGTSMYEILAQRPYVSSKPNPIVTFGAVKSRAKAMKARSFTSITMDEIVQNEVNTNSYGIFGKMFKRGHDKRHIKDRLIQLEKVIAKCLITEVITEMEFDYSNRYQQVEDVARDLRLILDGEKPQIKDYRSEVFRDIYNPTYAF